MSKLRHRPRDLESGPVKNVTRQHEQVIERIAVAPLRLFDDLPVPAPPHRRAVLRKPAAREAQAWCDRMCTAVDSQQKKYFHDRMVEALMRLDDSRGDH